MDAAKQPEIIRPQSGPQEAFLSSHADIVIYGGAAGGGKSFGLILEPIRHQANPGFGAVIFRRTYREVMAEGGLWSTCRELYPLLKAQSRVSDMAWKFPSGARVSFGHLDAENDVFGWQGAQIPLICFDELTHFSAFQFWYMLSRNRSTCGVRPYIRATCNPDPDSFVAQLVSWWIEQDSNSPNYGLPIAERGGKLRWFIRLNDDLIWGDTEAELVERYGSDVMPKSLTFIPASVFDNRILLAKDPGYLANLKALPLVERQRLLGGNWKIRACAGTIFRRDWFEVVDAVPSGLRAVRYWDRAATEPSATNPDPDWTAGVKIGLSPQGVYYIIDVARFRSSPLAVRQGIRNVSLQDGNSVYQIGLEQDPGQSGKAEVQDLIRFLSGFNSRAYLAESNKVVRAQPLSAQAEQGNVKLVRGLWNQAFIDELVNFPEGLHDDQVDGASGGFRMLQSPTWEIY